MSLHAEQSARIASHSGFSSLAQHVIDRTGLDYYQCHLNDLALRVAMRIAVTGTSDLDSYVKLLENHSEFDELAKLLTIGETYFFRHRAVMDALQTRILPDLIQKRKQSLKLNIWSAGCSVGAEPYTLSIMLRQLLGDQIHNWSISIVGTDINLDFLTQAISGTYAAWAMRGIDDSLRRTCFNKIGSYWQIMNRYKSGVHFYHHNLVIDPPPFIAGQNLAFDLILCRNVFIYFNNERVQELVSQFRESLANDGCLVVGHSEMNPALYDGFAIDGHDTLPIYWKQSSTVSPNPPVLPAWTPFNANDVTPIFEPHHVEPALPHDPGNADHERDVIDEYANNGHIDRAIELSRNTIVNDRLDPRGYLRHVMLLQEDKQFEKAASAVKQAVYLERMSPFAHYLAGDIHRQRGERKEAVRAFRSAVDLLADLDDTVLVHNADGITAGDLRRMVELQTEGITD